MKKIFWVIFGFLIVSILGNIYLSFRAPSSSQQIAGTNTNTYSLLSPRIFALNQNDVLINFVPLRMKLNDYVSGIKDQFGVYFEYLPSGVSIGMNEKDEFILVSLLKVPVVMAVYKNIEQGTTNPNDMLTITQADQDSKFGNLYKEPLGTKISVQDAIRLTLTQSDNTAKNLLGHTLSNADIVDVFDYLDIPKDTQGQNLVVSPKNYSSILRSLYLSSYLQKEHSNEILNYLTQSNFNDKLIAGIPSSVKVAHKIGVYDPNTNDMPVFTDCGIVYALKRPYILCMMTKTKEENARVYMSTISKMIYDYVASANK